MEDRGKMLSIPMSNWSTCAVFHVLRRTWQITLHSNRKTGQKPLSPFPCGRIYSDVFSPYLCECLCLCLSVSLCFLECVLSVLVSLWVLCVCVLFVWVCLCISDTRNNRVLLTGSGFCFSAFRNWISIFIFPIFEGQCFKSWFSDVGVVLEWTSF